MRWQSTHIILNWWCKLKLNTCHPTSTSFNIIFYNTIKVFIISRWCFGFPSKTRNINYNELACEPFVKHVRYFLFILLFYFFLLQFVQYCDPIISKVYSHPINIISNFFDLFRSTFSCWAILIFWTHCQHSSIFIQLENTRKISVKYV